MRLKVDELGNTEAVGLKENSQPQQQPLPDQGHTLDNPTFPPAPGASMKPVDSNFEAILRTHLTQPGSDAAKRPPTIKRPDK